MEKSLGKFRTKLPGWSSIGKPITRFCVVIFIVWVINKQQSVSTHIASEFCMNALWLSLAMAYAPVRCVNLFWALFNPFSGHIIWRINDVVITWLEEAFIANIWNWWICEDHCECRMKLLSSYIHEVANVSQIFWFL